MESQTLQHRRVFKEFRSVCNRGSARYKTELAGIDQYKLDLEFADDVCGLPAKYSEKKYMDFLDKWGTVSFIFIYNCLYYHILYLLKIILSLCPFVQQNQINGFCFF